MFRGKIFLEFKWCGRLINFKKFKLKAYYVRDTQKFSQFFRTPENFLKVAPQNRFTLLQFVLLLENQVFLAQFADAHNFLWFNWRQKYISVYDFLNL